MKIVVRLYKCRILDFIFFFWMISILPLLSIFLTRFMVLHHYKRSICYSVFFAFLLYIVSLNFGKRVRLLLFGVTYIVAFVPALIVLSHLLIASVYLRDDKFIPVFLTNVREASDFVNAFMSLKIVLCLFAYFIPPLVYLIWQMKRGARERDILDGVKQRYRIFFMTASVSMMIWFAYENVRSVYVLDFYSAYVNYRTELRNFGKLAQERQHRTEYKVTATSPTGDPKVFVIVIGESLSRHHMSLYGYSRETNPLLKAQEKDLLIFKNVVSGNVTTNTALPMVLTFADNKHPDDFFTKPSIIDLFRNAGFTTYWITAQTFINGASESLYGTIAKTVDSLKDCSFEWDYKKDEGVLNPLGQTLDNFAKRNIVIFVHLQGSHLTYNETYPLDFNYFDDSFPFQTSLQQLSPDEKQVINEYDNSVRYNDYVVSSIINIVKQRSLFSYVLYFSDHGEEVFDFREVMFHDPNIKSRYMCDIPFILWRSDNYKKSVKIDEDVSRPYSTEDVIYSISQLSGLSYKAYDSTKSVFSPAFKLKERLVGGIPYDSLVPLQQYSSH
ncbi:sulfatase-like hydrolase/transferase [Chitinophagaceae bacterium 26-R-25]|nr:sulfatase-like hydrolase/transferase [Chitinophagaceae bacterium 26-R-25]